MKEKSKTDQRFKRLMYVLMFVLLVAYLTYKIDLIFVAFEYWEGQEILVGTDRAAK